MTQEFNTIAPTLIGDYATIKVNELRSQGDEAEAAKWEEGGVYRVALHSAVGGLSADVSGALGAGVSAATIPTIGDIINNANIPNELKTPLIEIAGTAIGAAAGSIGGNDMAGGVSGFSQTENNYLTHHEREELKNAEASCKSGNSEACQKAVELRHKDRITNWGEQFFGDIAKGLTGLYGGLERINDMDTSSMSLVEQGTLGYLFINKQRVLGENGSQINLIGNIEDIQDRIDTYNNYFDKNNSK